MAYDEFVVNGIITALRKTPCPDEFAVNGVVVSGATVFCGY